MSATRKTSWWLALRYFGGIRQFFSLSTGLSVIGMMIGVSSLVVSMAVFSGYTQTLEKTVQDAFGHVNVIKRGTSEQGEILKELEPLLKDKIAETPFVSAEAMLAHKGKISGIGVEGVDLATVGSVLNLGNQLIAGSLDMKGGGKALIGKGLAQKFGLKVGDEFRIVIPLANEYQAGGFRPKLGKFKVAGILSYGRYDFDSRYVVMPLKQVQEFAEIGPRITGYRLKLDDPAKARGVARAIAEKDNHAFWARDWQDINRNLFEAAKLEKAVLFFVLMILVVAAAFNIANTLFISVVQRYRDISVLKTLGADNGLVRGIFTAQGLIVGAAGAGLGIGLGLALCRALEWAQTRWQIVPAEVYKLDHINLDVEPLDLVLILGASLLVCLIATMVPARRGAKISPVEGLRYE